MYYFSKEKKRNKITFFNEIILANTNGASLAYLNEDLISSKNSHNSSMYLKGKNNSPLGCTKAQDDLFALLLMSLPWPPKF